MTDAPSDSARLHLPLLIGVMFVAFICVAIPLPVVPLQVTGPLGLSNVWAGLAVGVAFLSTILSRGRAGRFVDQQGARPAVIVGLLFYALGAAVTAVSGLEIFGSHTAFAALVVGRLLVGVGESIAGVGIISWGIGLVGPTRSGRVIAMVGAAIYGALALGGPAGLALLHWLGFAGAMGVATLLPLAALLVILALPGIAPHPNATRASFLGVLGRIWLHGSVVCLQGIGFASIGAFFVLLFRHHGWGYAGLGFTAFGGGFVLVRLVFGHLPDRIGGSKIATVSLGIETVGQLLIWSANEPLIALVGAFLTGLGCSLVYPAMGREVVHLIEPHLRATAIGGFSAFQDLAYGLTGPLAGLLADHAGYGSVFLVGTITSAIGCALAFALGRAGPRRAM